MLNFMGLGFNFGGKDTGLSRAVEGALGSVNKLMSGVGGVSSALGELSKQGRDPTTGFEHEMIKNNVSLNRMGAGLGKTGKQLTDFNQKSQGLALTMNRSAEEAGTAVGQFDRMREASTKAGIDSEKTMLKLQDATGVNAQVFADASLQMMKMQGMSKEAGQAIFDAMTEAGKATGDVPGALQETEKRMALLQRRSALLAQGFKGIGIEEFSKQIDQTAADMQRITKVSASTARAFSHGLAESIQTVGEDFKKLTVGVGTDIPEGLKGLALTTGDIKVAFDTMEDGPEGFMKTMRNMTKSMGGDKEKIGKLMTWINARTGQAFGPERASEIVNMLAASTEETDKNAKSVKNATGALKKYGDEAFKNGRTAAESMELAESMFVARIRNINKTANTFASEAGKSFKLLGNEMETLGKDKGPVGELTRSLVDLDQKGLVGLLPAKLQGTAVAVGGFTERLGKTLRGILSPLNLVESGLVLFGTAMTDAFLKQGKKSQALPFMERLGLAFESVGEDAVKYLETLPDKIIGVVDAITKTLGDFFGGKGGGAAGKWSGKIRDWWNRILVVFTKMEPILARIKTFAVDLWDGITTALDPSTQKDSDSAGIKMGQWIRSGWDKAMVIWNTKVWPEIKKFGQDFWGGLTDAMNPESATMSRDASAGSSIGKWIGDALKTAIEWVSNSIGPLLDKLFETLMEKVKEKALGAVTGAAGTLARGALNFVPGGATAGMLFDKVTGKDAAPTAPPRAAATQAALSSSANPISAIQQLQTTTEEAAKEQRQRDLEQKDREMEMLYYQRLEARRRGEPAFTPAGESSGGQSRVGNYYRETPTDRKPTTTSGPKTG